MLEAGSGFHPFRGRVSRHFGDQMDSEVRCPPRPRRRMKADDPYLSYHDIRLWKEDIDTLKNDWVTDNAIAFWQEYLEREVLSKHDQTKIILLRPSMTFLLMQTPDVETLRTALPALDGVTHIFLPINDCRELETAEGGTHWSLLLVSVVDGVAFHYDSLNPSNIREAEGAAKKMSKLLGFPLRFIDLDDSPQQHNSSDCGVYVCMQMRYLLVHKLLRASKSEKISMNLRGKMLNASQGRKEMLKIIEEFRKEGERRRSRSLSPNPQVKGESKSKSPPRIE